MMMTSDSLAGMKTTYLEVQLPVAIVGRLYLMANEKNKEVSMIIYHALQDILGEDETSDPAPTKKGDYPAKVAVK